MPAKHKICWALWIAGTALIVASWLDVVSVAVGWAGFAVAFAGTGLSRIADTGPTPEPEVPPEVGPVYDYDPDEGEDDLDEPWDDTVSDGRSS